MRFINLIATGTSPPVSFPRHVKESRAANCAEKCEMWQPRQGDITRGYPRRIDDVLVALVENCGILYYSPFTVWRSHVQKCIFLKYQEDCYLLSVFFGMGFHLWVHRPVKKWQCLYSKWQSRTFLREPAILCDVIISNTFAFFLSLIPFPHLTSHFTFTISLPKFFYYIIPCFTHWTESFPNTHTKASIRN